MAKFDINALKRKVLVKYGFFGSIIANVKFVESDKIDTAGTDGRIIYYNPKYLENLSEAEQVFVIAHEIGHIAFNHILRSDGRDHRLWNIATDSVINQILKKDGLSMPPNVVNIEDADKYDAEQMYEKLKKEQDEKGQEKRMGNDNSANQNQGSQNQQGNSNSQGGGQPDDNSQEQQGGGQSGSNDQSQGQDGENQDVGHDTHSFWEDAVKRHKEGKDAGDKGQEEIEKKQKELEGMGEQEGYNKNAEEKKKYLDKIQNDSIKKVAQSAGTSTNSETVDVGRIGMGRPIIEWRFLLKQPINFEVDFSKKGVIKNGIVVHELEKIPSPRIEILIDTSGSVNDELVRNFLRECKNIRRYIPEAQIWVGCFDTKFYGFQEIKNNHDIDVFEIKGRGGTDFDTAVNAFSDRVENKIIFTDGEASNPKQKCDATWIIYGTAKINPPGGKVIYITREQLRRLTNLEVTDENNNTMKL